MVFSKTIQMYIFDGNPNGRIMCELSNWNGRVYKISRNEISDFSNREDSENTGVYFLLGKDENNSDTIYWNDCIAVISKDNLLNKAHVKYLENKFYSLAKTAGRSTVVNSTVPTCSSISEYDEAMLQEFISNTKLLINTLGYKVFDLIEDTSVKLNQNQSYFYIKAARGAEATGIIVSDGFAVLKGSIIASSITKSMSTSLCNLRNLLLNKGIINADFCFEQNYTFTSPSLAAAVVMGRNANGRTEWKTTDKKTLKEIEEAVI